MAMSPPVGDPFRITDATEVPMATAQQTSRNTNMIRSLLGILAPGDRQTRAWAAQTARINALVAA
jgi:hypothetical protein